MREFLKNRIRRQFGWPRNAALGYALLVLIVSLLGWQWVNNWYQKGALLDKRSAVTTELVPYGSTLTAVINHRFAFLQGIEAYAQAHTDVSSEHAESGFNIFASSLYASAPGIRNLTIAPDGVQKFVYPLESNENVPGHDLVHDERPEVRADVQRAIETGAVALSGPYELRQGGMGLIARQAVFEGDAFWGLVTMVLDVPSILAEAGLNEGNGSLVFALKDKQGTVFFGDDALFENDPVVLSVNLPEDTWTLAAVPVGGWRVAQTFPGGIFRAGSFLLALLFPALVYMAVNRQSRLDTAVKEKTSQLDIALHDRQVSEAKYRSIVEDLPGLICSFLPGGQITYVNNAYCQYYDQTYETLVKQNFLTWIPQNEKDAVLAQIASVTTENPLVTNEHRVMMPNGEIRWQRWTNRAFFDENGQIVIYQSFGTDITAQKQAEFTLRENEARLRSIFFAAPIGIGVVIDRVFQEVNEMLCNMVGYSREELIGQSARKIYPADEDFKFVGEAKYAEIKERNIGMVETRFLRKDGRIIQALLSSTPIDPDDLSVGVTFTALDITDRKLADQALQASEAGYKTLFEEASDAIFVSDLYGRILAVNDHACEQLGYDRNALQELKLNDLLAPEFAVNSQEQIAEIVKSGHIVIETAHVHRDGRIIPIELSATIIEYEGETAVLGIARDMTKRLEEQNALEANEARLRKIFEAVPVGVGMVQDRVIIFANEAICRMLGYTHEALINQPARILYADDAELERVGRIKYPILVKEGTAVIETQFKHIDNQVIDVRMRSALIDPEDISAGVISLIINITEQKKSEKELTQYREHLEALVAERTAEIKQRVAEVEQLNRGMLNLLADLQATNEYVSRTAQQLEETNAELESFAYSVSHDLRAPLRHISGFVNLLQADAGDQLDEQSTYYLQVINKAAIKMGQLIDDLLAFSRMGRKELVKKRVNMNELLAEVQQQFTQDIGNRDVIWKIESLSEVMADPALLRQVWANLLENALKYTRIRPTTSIEIGQMPPGENNEVIFFVRDNGVGFDNRYIDKLFGVFQRLHRDEEFEGTGIGLATVRRIIHRHNGRVWAEGKIDKGATFFFTLPTSKNTISTKEIS